jgi:ectoine hydroxylase-related dioxygenase (phytanoyl-CoA dioxygenase family)
MAQAAPQPVAGKPAPQAAALRTLSPEAVAQYRRDGFYFPIRVMPEAEALAIRRKLEAHEARTGGPLAGSLRHKPHLLFTWLWDLVHHPRVLDAVEDVIGPDILCWSSSFFIKEKRDPAFVSWHQDSTYWGLSEPDVVTAWVALSPSTIEAGAMRVIPGSHGEQIAHRDTFDKLNLLTRGQEVMVDVDASKAVDLVLKPGEMSLHHVRLVHGSEPNRSDDRRIGFAVRYIPTYVRQVVGPRDYATLVRGRDAYGHFELEPRPEYDLAPAAVALHREIAERQGKVLYRGTAIEGFDADAARKKR